MSYGFDQYQQDAMRTCGDALTADEGAAIIVSALGLTGEAGEFADHVKKWFAQGHELDFNVLDKEAGDVLWYLARYAQARGTNLSEIALMNREKLASRYPDGFRTEDSVNRDA